MKDSIPPEMFQPLELPRKEASAQSFGRYRVYKDKTHFITVEAENAQEALFESGLDVAYRIERLGLYLCTVIPPDAAVDAEDAPTEPKGGAAPLSNDDVNKLLQG